MAKFKYVTVRIEQDDSPPNPRDEFDNLSTFFGPKGSRYLVGGKNDQALDHYALDEWIRDYKREGAVVVEFQSNAGTCYAVVTRERIRKEYGNESRKSLLAARRCCKGEIYEWKTWCDGEVYGFIVEDLDGNHLDSCWGFYGRKYAEQEAESSAQHFEEQARAAAQRLQDRLDSVSRSRA